WPPTLAAASSRNRYRSSSSISVSANRRMRLSVPCFSATRLAVAQEPTPPLNMTTCCTYSTLPTVAASGSGCRSSGFPLAIFLTPCITCARMGTLMMRTLRAGSLIGNHTHRRRLGLAKQRCLPRAFLLYHEPQDGPSNGLRSLPLVVSQRLLVAQVLQPLALLAADLGGVLPALHDRVPLRARSKRVGHGLFYDLLQRHASSPPGSVMPTPTSSSSIRILTASANPTAHSRRRASSLASSGVMSVSAGPSDDTTMRTWPLCVGCTTISASRSASYPACHRSASARAASSRSISRKARAARTASCVITGAVPFSTASVIPRNSSRVSGVRRSPGVGRALSIGLNLLLNQL